MKSTRFSVKYNLFKITEHEAQITFERSAIFQAKPWKNCYSFTSFYIANHAVTKTNSICSDEHCDVTYSCLDLQKLARTWYLRIENSQQKNCETSYSVIMGLLDSIHACLIKYIIWANIPFFSFLFTQEFWSRSPIGFRAKILKYPLINTTPILAKLEFNPVQNSSHESEIVTGCRKKPSPQFVNKH